MRKLGAGPAFSHEYPGQRLPLGLVWLRRDLRLHDNAALHAALRACDKVALAFVFDRDILDPLLQRGCRRIGGWSSSCGGRGNSTPLCATTARR
jgi:deoxyribodipyrimidine photo-lyase type I